MQSFLKQKPLEDKLLTVTWSLSLKKKKNKHQVCEMTCKNEAATHL